MGDHSSKECDVGPHVLWMRAFDSAASSIVPRPIIRARKNSRCSIISFLNSQSSEGAKACTPKKNDTDTVEKGMSSDVDVYESSNMDSGESFLLPWSGQTEINKFDTENMGMFSFSTALEFAFSQTGSNETVFQFSSPSRSYSGVKDERYIYRRYQRTSYSKKCWTKIPKELRVKDRLNNQNFPNFGSDFSTDRNRSAGPPSDTVALSPSSACCPTQTKSLFCEAWTAVCPTPTPVANALKFDAPTGTDVILKDGRYVSVNTRQQCITCMNDYGSKSLEELRLEHYAADKKGAQGGLLEGFVECISFKSSQRATVLSFGASSPSGTTIKYVSNAATEITFNEGNTRNRQIRFQCVTFMKEYGDKSFEELRMEDYAAGRKGPQRKINSSGGNSEGKEFSGVPSALSVNMRSWENFEPRPNGLEHKVFDFNKSRGIGSFGTPNSSPVFRFITTEAKSSIGDAFKGTPLIFKPHVGMDTIMRVGICTEIKTKFQCISCMPVYDSKSLEELRLEDYVANRKGCQYNNCDYGKSKETGFFGEPNSNFASPFGSKLSEPFFGRTETTGLNISSPSGTSLKFKPPTGIDTMMKGAVLSDTRTMLQCITCMPEYENKSLEELRLEDYAANRKGPHYEICDFNRSEEIGSSVCSNDFTGSPQCKSFLDNLNSWSFNRSTPPCGTTVQFNPIKGMDFEMRKIVTCHQCITCMPEYENMSFEELRMEDYRANRKGREIRSS